MGVVVFRLLKLSVLGLSAAAFLMAGFLFKELTLLRSVTSIEESFSAFFALFILESVELPRLGVSLPISERSFRS